jgi:hypothetical protein
MLYIVLNQISRDFGALAPIFQLSNFYIWNRVPAGFNGPPI